MYEYEMYKMDLRVIGRTCGSIEFKSGKNGICGIGDLELNAE